MTPRMTNVSLRPEDLPDLVRSYDVAVRLTLGREPDIASYAQALRWLCASGAVRQHSPDDPLLWSIRDHAVYSTLRPFERFRAYRCQFPSH